MADVTKFSGMFAKMAVEYTRSAPRRVSRQQAATARPAASPTAISSEEHAVRTAMEQALARRLERKSAAVRRTA